ncbi:MAG: hypothetical protein FWG84_06920 [Bacteroidales bacterium]|nr:hypothetical protein [Bacteroidales bacterium]
MKKLLLLLLLSFSFSVYSQEIFVEFSIEYRNDITYYIGQLEETDIKPVCLVVTYRNISDKSLYFSKISEGTFDIKNCSDTTRSVLMDKSPFPYYQNDTCKPYFTVGFKPNTDFFSGFSWEVRVDTICNGRYSYWYYDVIDMNGDLSEVVFTENTDDGLFWESDNTGKFIYNTDYLDNKYLEIKKSFCPADINDKNIWENFKDKFLFLKPNAGFISSIALIGFQISGGTFTFQLDSTKPFEYVDVVLPKQNDSLSNEVIRRELPSKIGEYELFKGDFVSNKTHVFFEGIKSKR